MKESAGHILLDRKVVKATPDKGGQPTEPISTCPKGRFLELREVPTGPAIPAAP